MYPEWNWLNLFLSKSVDVLVSFYVFRSLSSRFASIGQFLCHQVNVFNTCISWSVSISSGFLVIKFATFGQFLWLHVNSKHIFCMNWLTFLFFEMSSRPALNMFYSKVNSWNIFIFSLLSSYSQSMSGDLLIIVNSL